jgi:hypothetical protein
MIKKSMIKSFYANSINYILQHNVEWTENSTLYIMIELHEHIYKW